MYAEDDLLPISALQHLLFCPRQAALIHVERLWAENSLTLEGRHLHQKADAGKGEARKLSRGARSRPKRVGHGAPAEGGSAGGSASVRITRGLMLRSLQLGLFGKADVVEFRRPGGVTDGAVGQLLPLLALADGLSSGELALTAFSSERVPAPGLVSAELSSEQHSPTVLPIGMPYPIEYKRGKPKKNRCDEVQLCAQAFCLEEMLDVAVPVGAIFYGVTRRRVEVSFDEALRSLTRRLIGELREMVDAGHTPAAAWEKKCERCSLIHLCLPEARPGTDAASRYLKRAVGQALSAGPVGE